MTNSIQIYMSFDYIALVIRYLFSNFGFKTFINILQLVRKRGLIKIKYFTSLAHLKKSYGAKKRFQLNPVLFYTKACTNYTFPQA